MVERTGFADVEAARRHAKERRLEAGAYTLPRQPLSELGTEAIAFEVIRLVDGLTLVEADRVLARCREIIAQTHKVSMTQAESEVAAAIIDQAE